MTSILFAVSTLLVASPQSLLDDPKLKATYDVSALMRELPQVIDGISAATHSKLAVDPRLAKLKLDLFVDDRPASWLLSRIATLFDAKWVDRSGTLTLEPISEAHAARQAFVMDETQRRDAARRLILADLANVAALPFPRLRAEVDRILSDVKRVESEGKLGWQDAQMKLLTELGMKAQAADDLPVYLAGFVIRAVGAQDDFGDRTLVGTTFPKELVGATVQLPEDALRWAEAWRNLPEGAVVAASIAFQAHDGHLHLRLSTTLADGTGEDRGGELRFDPEPSTGRTRFERFASMFRGKPHVETLAKRLGPAKSEKSGWYGGERSSGDAMRELGARSGFDVVSQALRAPIRSVEFPATTLNEWVTRFEEIHGGTFRIEDGAILFRPVAAEFRERNEIPESIWAELESASDSGFDPPVSAYVDFVRKLNPAQRALFDAERPLLSRVSPIPIQQATPALALLAVLSPGSIEALAQRRPVGRDTLIGDAASAFDAALSAGFGQTGSLSAFLASRTRRPVPKLAIFLDELGYGVSEVALEPGVKIADGVAPKSSLVTSKMTQVTIYLGSTISESVTFQFNLRRPSR